MVIKRVACLYRVSTKNQLTDSDIPMQKKACADFIKKQGAWKLVKEYMEKGVSGYHKPAEKRDELMQLKKDVINREFDILLVFMFDRLGRREDETPFIVEWLVRQNIEVWSVEEGQQRFDDHGDKLINYIRYWQSGSESEHTSMRVAEKHNQLVKDGKFRGGVAPYGYTLEYSGEFNKKGRKRKKLVIYEPEAVVVRRIFDLSCDIGMGSYRVAKLLNEEGAVTRTGKNWTIQTIVRMLRNPVYKGDYVTGKVRRSRGKKAASPKDQWVHSRELLKELMIVAPAIWEKANANISLRDIKRGIKRGTKSAITEHMRSKDGFLFYGVAYCGYCNTKLYPRTSSSKRRLKGTNKVIVYWSKYYSCLRRLRSGNCDGQFLYGVKRIEAVIFDEIYLYLENIKAVDISRLAKNYKVRLLKKLNKRLKPIEQKIASLRKEIPRLEEEILKCLTRESAFTEKQLSEAISCKTTALSVLEQEKDSICNDTADITHSVDELIDFKLSVVSWKKEFIRANTEKQKALIGMVVDKVHISRGTIDIIFRYSLYDIEDICDSKTTWHGGAPPACPVGSSCDGCWGDRCEGGAGIGGGACNCFTGRRGWGWGPGWRDGICGCGRGRNRWGWGGFNWLGSVAEIPCDKIVSFTHNSI